MGFKEVVMDVMGRGGKTKEKKTESKGHVGQNMIFKQITPGSLYPSCLGACATGLPRPRNVIVNINQIQTIYISFQRFKIM